MRQEELSLIPRIADPKTAAARAAAERRWVWRWAVVALLITCLPYLFALAVAVPSRFFVGSLHLPDDSYVYLAWMRQAQEGRLTFTDRFTTDPQSGGFFNLLFLLLGWGSRLTGVPGVWVFHVARVVFGIAFLLVAHRLLCRLLPDERARRAAFLLLCFSAGLGWLFPRDVMRSPTDLWQAETNTFLSLYLNPLFAAALWLMALTFERLWAARESGRLGPAAAAGVAALVLANIHSYDILIVWAVWAAFLAVAAALRLGVRRSDLLAGGILFVLPLPAVWQQWRFYATDPVFHARVLTATPSPALIWYLLGLGLLVPLGAAGCRLLAMEDDKGARAACAFLAAWAVVGLAIPYLPFAFQRKLAMGIHLPWAIFAGVGLSRLAGAARARPGIRWSGAVLLGVLATAPTLGRWYARALQNIEDNWCEGYARIFLSGDEADAMRWLSRNAGGEATLAAPLQLGGVAGYLPALAGVATYAGHWGETPDFPARLREARRFYSSAMTDEERRILLRRAGIRYVYWSAAERIAAVGGQAGPEGPSPADLSQMAGLRQVFQAGAGDQAVIVFRVE